MRRKLSGYIHMQEEEDERRKEKKRTKHKSHHRVSRSLYIK